MKNSDKVLAGMAISAAVAAIVFVANKKKSKKVKKHFVHDVQDFVDHTEDQISTIKGNAKEKIVSKVFDFAVSNRKMIGKVTSFLLPYVLKNYVKKKL